MEVNLTIITVFLHVLCFRIIMARVTIEKSLEKVESKFELVVLATERAYALMYGAEKLIHRDDNRADILALREIEEGLIDVNQLREEIAEKYSTTKIQKTLSDQDQRRIFSDKKDKKSSNNIFSDFNLNVED